MCRSERRSSIPFPYLGRRYGTLKDLHSKGVPYLPHLPYLFPPARAPARTRTRVYVYARTGLFQVWKVWKVWKDKARQGFQGSIPWLRGLEGMESGRRWRAEWMR